MAYIFKFFSLCFDNEIKENQKEKEEDNLKVYFLSDCRQIETIFFSFQKLAELI